MTGAPLKVSLTGIKPTGEPHIGNYIGAIRPALELAKSYQSIYFIADYHALTSIRDPKLLRHYTRSVAAGWLAAGLDPQQTIIYRQSDIPETFELSWILSCMSAKGLMNRAHAYKAARDRNKEQGVPDLDSGINMGLFNYPILMAVDILLMQTDVVPVGKDQVQHVEYAADIAGSFNHIYGEGYILKIPKAITPESSTGQVLPGLDGRKMSKSYDNTIPLFGTSTELKKLIKRMKTDTTPVEKPKDPDSSSVFLIYENFATTEKITEIRQQLKNGGMGWGHLKEIVFAELDEQLTPMRERYNALMEPDSELDAILTQGAVKARDRAIPLLRATRQAIGI